MTNSIDDTHDLTCPQHYDPNAACECADGPEQIEGEFVHEVVIGSDMIGDEDE